ncbi:MAG: H-type lectin domain-containing protein [Sulfitobacter sp.]
MKRLRNHLVGIDQGSEVLFSDFEDNGEMWTGQGQRERRVTVTFAEPFRGVPVVHVSMSLWDMAGETVMRADLSADHITQSSFDIVFRTWGDTRVARVRANWMAFGELRQADEWDIY